MKYKKLLLVWVTVFVVAFILDLIARMGVTGTLVQQELNGVLKSPENVFFPVLFIEYALLATGLTFFLTETNALKKSIRYSAFVGGLIGLMIYGIYSLINITFLIKWSWTVVFVDAITGLVVLSLTASIVYLLFHKK